MDDADRLTSVTNLTGEKIEYACDVAFALLMLTYKMSRTHL
jgi:hypothetical protein